LTVSDAGGCEGEAAVEVTTTVGSPAIASPDFTSCSDTAVLSANLPEGTNGEWSTTGPAVINNPVDSVTLASELSVGINLFIWTLSTAGCPEYSRDTVRVMRVEPPLAEDDQFVINTSDGLTGVFDLLANDQWALTDNYEVRLLTEPILGRVDSLEEGFLYYQLLTAAAGQETLVYELCSDACPQACSEALLTIIIKAEEKVMDIPNGITPNGDGLNDTFVFDIIELSDPEDIPDNRLIIFNRWGDIVYDKSDYDNSWNGVNDRGEKLPHGTYYYVLYLNIAKRQLIRGDVTILE
jgi:gliding motility-associated-like protein